MKKLSLLVFNSRRISIRKSMPTFFLHVEKPTFELVYFTINLSMRSSFYEKMFEKIIWPYSEDWY